MKISSEKHNKSILKHHLTPAREPIIKKTTSIGEAVEQEEQCAWLMGI